MKRSSFAHKPLVWAVLSLAFGLVSVSLTSAQSPVTITLGVPGFIRGILSETIIADFEADNPDIHVELVDMNEGPSYFPGDDMDTYLDDLREYVSLADVMIFDESSLIPEATRAGYVLDLMSFIRSDPEINTDDFYPQFWNAFQWDGGMWAFPIAGDVIGLIYNPEAFDEAGLPYPDANWTLADFETAVRALSEIDPVTGEIANSAAQIFDERAPIILSLLNKPLYDPNTPDALPAFDDPELQTLAQQWYDLTASGLFNQGEGGFSLDLPMVISRSVTGIAFRVGPADEDDDEDEPEGPKTRLAPLPGGRSLLTVNGVGISAGSQHPDEAYRLIKYLSNSPEAATAFLSAVPARRALVGAEVDTSDNSIARVVTNNDPERMAEIEALLATAYSPSETMYAAYINTAMSLMTDPAYDVNTAFEEQEATFVTGRETAAVRNGTVIINVALPTSEVVLAPGEVALNFGLAGFGPGPANETEWKAAIDEFVANDPEVGAIHLETADMFQGGFSDLTETYDCFYENTNSVPNADLSLLIPLDAYLASDAGYNADDLVSGAMEQVMRDGQTWAMPLSVQPTAMWYNPEKVSEAGAFPPYEGWTIGDFETALRALKATMNDTTTAPFISRDGGTGTYILQLIAAYGGLPMDLSQTPPVIDFDSEQSIAATKQVLDLARAGYIQYEPLGEFGGVRMIFGDDTTYALYTQSLGGFFNFRRGGPRGEQEQTIAPSYNLVSFPQGTDYMPIAFNISAAYISAQSAAPEACYRFIQSLTKRPALFGGMPVLRSLLDSDTVIATYGQSAVDFYRAVDSTLTDPRAARFTGMDGRNIAGENLVTLWLYRAWDNYYADESVDLTKELQDAQFYADAYLECLALAEQEAPPAEGGVVNRFNIWRECAVKVDPALEDLLPNF